MNPNTDPANTAISPTPHGAPLGLLHPDSTPVTLSDCERQAATLSAKHAGYTKALKLLEQDAGADRFEFAELSAAARWSGLAFDAWASLAALMRGAVSHDPS